MAISIQQDDDLVGPRCTKIGSCVSRRSPEPSVSLDGMRLKCLLDDSAYTPKHGDSTIEVIGVLITLFYAYGF
jgi:hypothetical protein